MYRLLIVTKSGNISKHFYDDYDTLDYNATFCQFSPNILKATGQKLTWHGWDDLFTIESK